MIDSDFRDRKWFISKVLYLNHLISEVNFLLINQSYRKKDFEISKNCSESKQLLYGQKAESLHETISPL